jgi:hypothetical protein
MEFRWDSNYKSLRQYREREDGREEKGQGGEKEVRTLQASIDLQDRLLFFERIVV